MALTNTCSESVGPVARVWWAASRCLGHVCYLYWPDVHARLLAQAAQVCHIVSLQLSCCLVPSYPVKERPAAAFLPAVRSYKANRQRHIPCASFGTAMRTHAVCNVFKDRMFRPPTADVSLDEWSRLTLSSHCKIGTGPSVAIMRVQGSARCRVQTAFMSSPVSTLPSRMHIT
jgi:hypothetical protein